LVNGDNGPYLSSAGFYTYSPDTFNVSFNNCGSDFDSAILVFNPPDGSMPPIGFNDDCNDGPYGDGNDTNAPCWHVFTDFGPSYVAQSCTCVRDVKDKPKLLIWVPTFTGADPPLGSTTVIEVEKKFTCGQPWDAGACCHGETGICDDNVPPTACMGPQDTYTHNKLCINLPPCVRHTGSCCDGETGLCRDDTFPEGCTGVQEDWAKGIRCADRPVPCTRHTGACCDGTTGNCAQTFPEDCDTTQAQTTWTKGGDCADCQQHTGACCDHATPGGSCTPGILPQNCVGGQKEWFKGESCTEVEANGRCEEHTGACCDHETGDCTQAAQSACNCPKCEWSKDTPCSAVECDANFEPIPTVSEWGLAILALLLLTGAKIYFGRRQAIA
jgi:hypothetical protein